jgi:hypothetical protein
VKTPEEEKEQAGQPQPVEAPTEEDEEIIKRLLVELDTLQS